MIVQRAGPDEPAMVRRGKENAVAAVAIRFSRTLRFGKIWLSRIPGTSCFTSLPTTMPVGQSWMR